MAKKNISNRKAPVKGKSGRKSVRPFLFFLGGFVLLMASFYAFYLSVFFEKNISPRIELLYASISSAILNLIGQHTQSESIIISSPAFSISVNTGCDAIEAMALFVCAVLSFPMKWSIKWKALLSGILILFVLNIIRIISLFLTGVYAPDAFEMMHVEVWQALFIIFSLALWLYWISRKRKQTVHVA